MSETQIILLKHCHWTQVALRCCSTVFSNAWIDVEDSVKICVEWTPSTSLLLHMKVQELAHVVTN